MTVGIIGTGNVAWHLIRGFQTSPDIQISWVFGRKSGMDSFEGIPYYSSFEKIETQLVDLILVCVNDDSIQKVLTLLPKDVNVAYTSGTVDLKKLNFQQANCGVFYPLQTFTKGKHVELKNVPFLIEATNEDFALKLENLASQLSQKVLRMNSEQRKQLHIAAVFTNNFVNHLLYLSQSHLENHQIDQQLLQPLLEETVKKAIELGSYNAQSGPARRNDQQTIQMHEQELNGIPKEIYSLITTSILKTYSNDDV